MIWKSIKLDILYLKKDIGSDVELSFEYYHYGGSDSWGDTLGFDNIFISTSNGLMTDREARKQKVGGEILAYVW